MTPVNSIKSVWTLKQIKSRMIYVLGYMGHQIAAYLGDSYTLRINRYTTTSSEGIRLANSEMYYYRHIGKFSNNTDYNLRLEIVNEYFDYKVLDGSLLNLKPYPEDKNKFFAPKFYINEETFTDLHQHFINHDDASSPLSYKLDGKLKDLDEVLHPGNFSGDPLTRALKAKVMLDLMFMKEDADCQCKGQSNKSKDGKSKGESEGERKKKVMSKLRTNKDVDDDARGWSGSTEEGRNEADSDLIDKTLATSFLRDKGVISNQQVDLSFKTQIKRTKKKSEEGEFEFTRQKKHTLKGLRKGDIAHPNFMQKFITKQNLQKERWDYEDNYKRIVFVIVDISGSMDTIGKHTVRNAIIADRLEALMNGHCRLFVGGYLYQIEDFKEITNPQDAAYFLSIIPDGGGTSVESAVKDLISREEFKEAMADGTKGEIIVVNDGEDTMGPFENDGSFVIHGMQLGNGPEAKYAKEGLVHLCSSTGGKFLYFDTSKYEGR